MPTVTVTVHYEINEPEPQSTLFGACPASGGESLSSARSVGTKYGTPVAVRQFMTSFKNPNVHGDFSIVHTSYKQNNDADGVIAGVYDWAITNLANNTPDGHIVEWMHEHDKKIRDGVFTYQQLVTAKNHFYDVVKAANPNVLVAQTVTGWEMDPAAGRDINRWSAIKADLFGIDLDGIHVSNTPYPNFLAEIETTVDWIDRYNYQGWCVPEFGTSRAGNDSSGTARANWALDYGQRFKDAGAHYVALYDYESTTGNQFTTAAELSAWKSLVTG